MKFPFFRLTRRQPCSPEDLEMIRSIFSKFQRIQKLNTRALEIMAEMERALGGEYIFDRAFLESSVRELGALTYQVVYSLNALADNRYIELFDRYQGMKSTLEDILAGGAGPFADRLTLPFAALGWEMEPVAGAAGVYLAEIRNRLGIAAPDGFVVTAAGCREFFRYNRIGKNMDGSSAFPPELEESIMEEAAALFKRRGGPVDLIVRATAAGDYSCKCGAESDLRPVSPGDVLDACRSALGGFHETMAEAGRKDFDSALVVHETIPSDVAGSVRLASSGRSFRVSAQPANAPDAAEVYLLQRAYPFDLSESRILPKDFDCVLDSGLTPLYHAPDNLRRGSALLSSSFLKGLAETASALERFFGYPVELNWARAESGRPVILDARPAAEIEDSGEPVDLSNLPERFEVLIQGGETAQSGISAGKVVHVSSHDDAENFEYGSIAVARTASPQLSLVLRKASAIVTETGNAISHLATIARELRVPGVFGAPGALDLLPEGCEVTVDAAERTVYRGIVEELLNSRGTGSELFPTDPEYIVLRLLLRLILPLGLLDPESPDFAPSACSTFHDIIHFCHERSVEELLNLHERHRRLECLSPRRLSAGVPIEIYVLDVDTGFTPASESTVGLEELSSEPFQAFIRGLLFKEMWDRSPASLRFRDIFANIDRTFSVMSRQDYSGTNLAVVARNYMNLALHLGYHFSVIDSYIGDNENQNYIYFRFAGGFAEERRRRRRAELIRTLLEGMDFKVTLKGDLVVGKFKTAGRTETAAVLARLGELTAFTRQLDVSMVSEANVEEFTRLFLLKSEGGSA